MRPHRCPPLKDARIRLTAPQKQSVCTQGRCGCRCLLRGDPRTCGHRRQRRERHPCGCLSEPTTLGRETRKAFLEEVTCSLTSADGWGFRRQPCSRRGRNGEGCWGAWHSGWGCGWLWDDSESAWHVADEPGKLSPALCSVSRCLLDTAGHRLLREWLGQCLCSRPCSRGERQTDWCSSRRVPWCGSPGMNVAGRAGPSPSELPAPRDRPCWCCS